MSEVFAGDLVTGELPQVYRLALPYTEPPVTANEARSSHAHWRVEAAAKRNVAEAVAAVVRAARVPALPRVAIALEWLVPDYRKVDPDGLYVMLKYVIDALTPPREALPKGGIGRNGQPRKVGRAAKVGVGIIPDDSARYVESTLTRVRLGMLVPRPRIELHLTPHPPLVVPRARRPR